jgi:hypothetical protein
MVCTTVKNVEPSRNTTTVVLAPRDEVKATCAEGILEAVSRNRADLLV